MSQLQLTYIRLTLEDPDDFLRQLWCGPGSGIDL